jgi:hypothetical protein
MAVAGATAATANRNDQRITINDQWVSELQFTNPLIVDRYSLIVVV